MPQNLIRGSDGRRRCWWGASTPDYERYHDEEWGRPGHRRPRPLRAHGRSRASSRALLAHDPAQARELPRGVRELRDREVARLRRPRRQAAARRRRHRPPPRRRSRRRSRTRAPRPELDAPLRELVWSSRRAGAGAPRAALDDLPPVTAESTALAKELKRRGFRFVGPTTALRAHAGLRARQRPPWPGCWVRAEVGHGPLSSAAGMDERALTERLITYDTSTLEGMQARRRLRQGLARGA